MGGVGVGVGGVGVGGGGGSERRGEAHEGFPDFNWTELEQDGQVI